MTVKQNPLVSIIMPAFNAEHFIRESIDSIQQQTYKNWELWITNDASTDDTQKIVEKYIKDERIHLVNFPVNRGLAVARNAGIEKSNGEYVAFLDSDDLWLPEKLDHQIKFHRDYPEIGLSFTNFNTFDKTGECDCPRDVGNHKMASYPAIDVSSLFYKNTIGILTVMVKKEILDTVGYFDSDFRSVEDHDLWIRIAKVGYKFGYLDEKLALYRLSEGGLSRSLRKYKSQRKKFLRKHYPVIDENIFSKKAWGTFYRHFGNEYSQRKVYELARKYYFKALICFGFSMTGLRMAYFYFRSSIRAIF